MGVSVPELADGDQLAHTDLHGDHFLLGSDGTTHVIDWGYPGTGAWRASPMPTPSA